VFCWIVDRNGFGKLRPAVVITDDEEIEPDSKLVVMAITTTFRDPPPSNHVTLPWHPRGHPVTRLTKRSAAVVDWLSPIHPSDIAGYGGDVPERIMRVIQSKLGKS
jgi:mRNA-degrading endonuclease toxin of MazEF toxin-antitoxin module